MHGPRTALPAASALPPLLRIHLSTVSSTLRPLPSPSFLSTLHSSLACGDFCVLPLLHHCTSGSSSHTHTPTQHTLTHTHIIHTLGELISGSFVVGQLPLEAVAEAEAEAELRLSCLGSCLMRYQNFCFITLVSRRSGGVARGSSRQRPWGRGAEEGNWGGSELTTAKLLPKFVA